MIELYQALYSLLSTDATLSGLVTGVHQEFAPQGTALPVLIFYPVPGTQPQYTFGGEAWDEVLVGVKASAVDTAAAAGADTAEQIRARVRTILSDALLSVSGGTLLRIYREGSIHLTEEHAGVIAYTRGDFYRALITRS